MKAWKHFCTINHHKMLVMKGCFKVGLYRQGLLHDLSKYSPTEFLVGCKYFQGNMSPNNAEREDKGYSAAWLHHKGRNKHHMESVSYTHLTLPTTSRRQRQMCIRDRLRTGEMHRNYWNEDANKICC